jgi:dihydrofolate reductase
MRKLVESVLVSLDGVIESPEQWAKFDDEDAAIAMERLAECDAFVLGRATYEKLSANFGDLKGDPYIDLINAKPKYVASRTLTRTSWNATLLGPDAAAAIAQLKNEPGKDLIKYGTGRFDDTLVQNLLVDEFQFWVRPVVVGSGQRLFEGVDMSGLALRLTGVKKLKNESVILSYRPTVAHDPS